MFTERYSNTNYTLCCLKVSRADIIALVAGALLLSIGASVHSKYKQFSMVSIANGGLVSAAGVISIIKKNCCSRNDDVRQRNIRVPLGPEPAPFSQYPELIRSLFVKNSQLIFDSMDAKDEYAQQLEDFYQWYRENQNLFDPSNFPLESSKVATDNFHKEMVDRLYHVIVKIDLLPSGFENQKVKLKEKFLSDFSELYFGAFRETIQPMRAKSQQRQIFEESVENLTLYLTSKFSSYSVSELQFIINTLDFRRNLVLFCLSH